MEGKIVIFNGPPHSGKDTLGALCKGLFGGQEYKFARALKDGLIAMFWGALIEERGIDAARGFLEERKDKQMFPNGTTGRRALISLSEDWAKPLFGKDVWGRVLAQRITANFLKKKTTWSEPNIAWVTDGGFIEEMLPLFSVVGAEHIILVQLMRTGCSFANDSREYVSPEAFSNSIWIDNSGTIDETKEQLIEKLTPFLYGQIDEKAETNITNS